MSENFKTLFNRAERMLQALPTGAVDPEEAAKQWRRIADLESDPVRRAEALINLATALDYTGEEGRIQAIAIADRALKVMGPKHYQAASALLMAAQRLLRDLDSCSEEDQRRALAYLHAALAVPMTAQVRQVLVGMLVRYSTVAPRLRDFSKLAKAQHIFDRLRKYGMAPDEIFSVFGAMVGLYQARWTAQAHRPSLGKAITLSSEALDLFKSVPSDKWALELSDLQQQHAILILERYEHEGALRDYEIAVRLLREASKINRNRAAIFNSLAIVLAGSDSKPTSDFDFEEARLAIDEGMALAVGKDTIAHLHWTKANWHLQAYWRGEPVDHLDSAVQAAEMAVELQDTFDDRMLFTLSQAYRDRYCAGHEPGDIDRAIDAVERGLALCPEEGSDRWRQEVTAANIYQDRALNGPFGFDESDAARAIALLRAALERLPRNSQSRTYVAANALGTLIEHYVETGDGRILDAAAVFARMLPDKPELAANLPAIAVCNLAVFHLHFAEEKTARAAWIDLLRDIVARNEGEASWLAASNLMHLHVRQDWAMVIEAFQYLARQRATRLASARSSRERTMVLRREQSVAAIAGLAHVHLGQFADAARLIDQSQAALLGRRDGQIPAEDDRIWASYDAVFYPVSTRYGAYVLKISGTQASGALQSDIRIKLPEEPSVPDQSAMTAAAALIQTAFGASLPARLLIVPTGELGSIPWASVPVGNGTLIDHSEISVLPTRHFWRPLPAEQPSELLIVDGANAIPNRPLRHACAETSELRRLFPAGLTLGGADATRAATLTALSDTDIAHFACHGEIDPSDPLRSHLLLVEGDRLMVQDLLDTDVGKLRVASLSACRSGVYGRGMPDEFASLAVAFLVAGAHAAIGTLWNVNDVAASLFSRRFYHGLRSGMMVATAARDAQLWLRDSSDSEKADWLESHSQPVSDAEIHLRNQLNRQPERSSFQDPKYWAAFACYGC